MLNALLLFLFIILINYYIINNYRPRSRGDNAFGSVRVFVCVCVCLFVCVFVRALLFEPLDLGPSFLVWGMTLT